MSAFLLHVLSGTYAGLRQPLEATPVTIGSAPEADLVFYEDVLAPVHVRLSPVSRHKVSLSALGPHVVVRDGNGARHETVVDETIEVSMPIDIEIDGTVPSGTASPAGSPQRLSLRLEAVLRPGEIETIPPERSLALTPPDAHLPATPPSSPWTPILLTLPLVLLALATQVDPASWDEVAPVPTVWAGDPTPVARLDVDSAVQTPAPRGSGPAFDGLAENALIALRNRLDQQGVTGIRLSRDGSVVTASGQVDASQRAYWEAVQRWFDGVHGGDVTLVSRIPKATVASGPTPPPVESAWTGANPYIVSRGRRYAPGAAMGDGWTLVEVASDFAVLSRNETRIRVPY